MKTNNYSEIITIICDFLNSNHRKTEIFFCNGFFITIKKRSKNKRAFLEIHTSGFDGVLPLLEAIDWIKWTLIDYKANNIIL